MEYSTLIRKKDKGYQYIISYKHNGKWSQKSKQGFKKRGDAQSAMDNRIKELKNHLKNNTVVDNNQITFKKFCDTYIDHIKLYREANTVLALQNAIKAFVPLFDMELSKVTSLDIQKAVDKLTRKGLRLSTIKDYINKLNVILGSALKDYNLISKLPTTGVKIATDKNKYNKRALNSNETSEIINFFKNYGNQQYHLIILIALKCGLRLGEILGLTWDDIDFKDKVIRVNKQWKLVDKNKYGFGTLKSKNSNRTVPIPKLLIKELNGFGKVKNIDNRLFTMQSIPSTSICLSRFLRLNGFDITVHELRHTYATMLIANGIDFKTAAKLLGHTVEQTMKTYSHVNDDMMSRAVNIIENVF